MTRRPWFLALVASAALAAVIFAAARFTTSEAGSGDGDIPTEAEAQAYLAETHDRAKQAADASAFCEASEAPLTCVNQYRESGGRSAVPSEPPQVVESWTTGKTRVLTVCGVDGVGHTYRADFPVRYGTEGPLITVLDVFWNSKTYSGQKAPGDPVIASPRPQKFSC